MSQVIEYLRRATDFLHGCGVGNPRLDAEVLLADVLGVDRMGVYLKRDRPLSGEEVSRYREILRRRGRREPLQHIRGRQEFFSRDFGVDARVLVPRMETEGLVEAVLECLAGRDRPRVLDVGCGSGVIAATVALERPDARVAATEISTEALGVARENFERLGARVDLREGDLLGPFAGETFDAIVSNPPYIVAEEIESLEPEVRDFDPHFALDGGFDGLATFRRLIADAAGFLSPSGFLLVEVGAGQGGAVAELARGAGLADVMVREDLTRVGRVVSGRKGF